MSKPKDFDEKNAPEFDENEFARDLEELPEELLEKLRLDEAEDDDGGEDAGELDGSDFAADIAAAMGETGEDGPAFSHGPTQPVEGHRFGAVVLMGPPNAGKSTLLNQIIGQKVAIVSPRPQTTRNRISGIYTAPEAQVLFLDTPGVHRLRGRMNKLLLQSAWNALAMADVCVVLLDGARCVYKSRSFEEEIAPLAEPVAAAGRPLFVAVNKVDLVREKPRLLGLLTKVAELWPQAEIFPVSALTGEGVDALMAAVLERLPEGPAMFPADQVSEVSMRFMAAEVIREKLFSELREELPYGTAVEIESWQEEGRLTRIHAVILVERSGHKGMVIGKGGALLKKIGAESRAELEEMLDGKVWLELWVKVRERWTEDVGFLRSMGLGE